MPADPHTILEGLNPSQREAAEAVRGPVAIRAGAGTGKTTTITRRIAFQVATRAFEARQILAVTFTQKAAGELKERLGALGVGGVEARTFHSAALSQLGGLWQRATGEPLPEVLDHKAPLISSLANALPPPHKFLPRRELAGEIEWAKNRQIPANRYLDGIARAGHEPPIPADLMAGIYDGYEKRKERMGNLDFEDMLTLAVKMLTEFPEAADAVRSRFASFTVDEYQDVNPLQAALLDAWLGERDEVCVVGDDYQTIYTFTGASPDYLLDFPKRYPGAQLISLEENYRSSPQVLELANRLAPKLGGFDKRLRATRGDGPPVTVQGLTTQDEETDWVIRQARRLHEEGELPWEEIAILFRINARTEPYEEALAAATIPYQVRDGAFLRRPGPRAVLAGLRRAGETTGDIGLLVEQITTELGYDPSGVADSDDEATRQADMGRLRQLASEYTLAHGIDEATPGGFATELAARFSAEESGRGVQLMTYHRAKGLEYDAVFLPRLSDGELPFRSGRSVAEPEEERRLFYVGITRARHYLALSWSRDARGAVSPFVAEATGRKVEPKVSTKVARPKSAGPVTVSASADAPLFERLKAWRKARAGAAGVPAYVVFHDKTLAAIAEARPGNRAALFVLEGVGPAKLDRYGDELLEIISQG